MNEKKVLRSFAMVAQIGISMMVPVFLCGVIGRWLNGLLNSDLPFLFALFIGMGAALRNLFMVTKSFYASDLKKGQEQADYMRNLKEYRSEHPEEVFSDVMEGKKKRYPENKGPTRH